MPNSPKNGRTGIEATQQPSSPASFLRKIEPPQSRIVRRLPPSLPWPSRSLDSTKRAAPSTATHAWKARGTPVRSPPPRVTPYRIGNGKENAVCSRIYAVSALPGLCCGADRHVLRHWPPPAAPFGCVHCGTLPMRILRPAPRLQVRAFVQSVAPATPWPPGDHRHREASPAEVIRRLGARVEFRNGSAARRRAS